MSRFVSCRQMHLLQKRISAGKVNYRSNQVFWDSLVLGWPRSLDLECQGCGLLGLFRHCCNYEFDLHAGTVRIKSKQLRFFFSFFLGAAILVPLNKNELIKKELATEIGHRWCGNCFTMFASSRTLLNDRDYFPISARAAPRPSARSASRTCRSTASRRAASSAASSRPSSTASASAATRATGSTALRSHVISASRSARSTRYPFQWDFFTPTILTLGRIIFKLWFWMILPPVRILASLEPLK